MAEHLRSVNVRVEVDTNKRTEVLDRRDLDLDQMETAVREFIEGLGLGFTSQSQTLLDIATDALKRIALGTTNNPTALARTTLSMIKSLRDEE